MALFWSELLLRALQKRRSNSRGKADVERASSRHSQIWTAKHALLDEVPPVNFSAIAQTTGLVQISMADHT